MFGKQKKYSIIMVAFLMVAAMMLPTNVSAAIKEPSIPYASDYLTSYNTYVCAMGDGKLEVWFSVTGVNFMDDVGTLTIILYESTDNATWEYVETFRHDAYANMLGHNVVQHNSYISYQGIAGRYYKAYVTIWAGKGDGGDARYMWTAVERAT